MPLPKTPIGPEPSGFTSIRTFEKYSRGMKYVVTPAVTITRKKVSRIRPMRILMVRQ